MVELPVHRTRRQRNGTQMGLVEHGFDQVFMHRHLRRLVAFRPELVIHYPVPHHLLQQVFSKYHNLLGVEPQTTRIAGEACVFHFLTELLSELV